MGPREKTKRDIRDCNYERDAGFRAIKRGGRDSIREVFQKNPYPVRKVSHIF